LEKIKNTKKKKSEDKFWNFSVFEYIQKYLNKKT